MKKKNKNLAVWGAGLVFFVGIVGLLIIGGSKGSSNPAAYSASVLSAPENTFDFKTISMEDGEVSHMFEVKNDGAETVTIEKVYTSCMCTGAYVTDSSDKTYGKFGMPGHGGPSATNIEVGPGDSVRVEAIFDPAAHGPSGVGLANRSIYIETNSQTSPKLELSFQAMVTR